MDLLLLFLFIFKTLHTHLVCTSGYWKYVLKQNEQNVLFQAEIIVKNVLLKISKLHFSFFVVRVMSRKWAMMSWICISCWYLKVVVVKTLEVRLTYFCRHSGRPVTALLAQGDCCCSTGSAGRLRAKPGTRAELWHFFSWDVTEIVARTCPGMQTLLLFYSAWWSCTDQAAQDVVVSKHKNAGSEA